jgi:hypothetical protein
LFLLWSVNCIITSVEPINSGGISYWTKQTRTDCSEWTNFWPLWRFQINSLVLN